jgi:hypothetical protein
VIGESQELLHDDPNFLDRTILVYLSTTPIFQV